MSRRIVPAEGWLTERPRAVLAVRATLYLVGGGVALSRGLDRDVSRPPRGVAPCLAVSALVAVGVRRLDARVVAAATPPDPIERLKRRYVDADIDEIELERRLERLLGTQAGDSGVDAASASARSRSLADARTESERA